MMNKIELSQFKLVLMISIIMISGVAIFSIQEIPQAEARINPFIGEITWYAFTFAPQGWAFCDGQLLSISSNTALFSLLGTTYGGDGETTFALPDMRGRIPIHQGTGPGLSPYSLGSRGGTETVTLTIQTMPSHSHTGQINVNNEERADEDSPVDNYLSKQWRRAYHDTTGTTTDDILAGVGTISNVGGGQPHNNMMPYQVLNCNIALVGLFPSEG